MILHRAEFAVVEIEDDRHALQLLEPIAGDDDGDVVKLQFKKLERSIADGPVRVIQQPFVDEFTDISRPVRPNLLLERRIQ